MDCILVVDQLGNIVDKNCYTANLMSKYFNMDKEIIGMNITKVFKDKPEIEKLMRSQVPDSAEVEILSEHGSCYLLCNTYPLGDGSDRLIGQVFIMRDITQKKLYELNLLERAERDGLTKLLNRQGFNESYDKIISALIEANKQVACLMIDIDYFKKINDSFGHAVGDKVLQNLAQTLRDALREKDIIGRIGGEEFAIILPGIDKGSAFAIAERIRKRVEGIRLSKTEGRLIEYTVSIGIADNGDFNIGLKNLLHLADMALYEAKEKSRNCTVIHNEP
jgi:diguanylate cyclase (GGDEF)-like protein